MYTLLFKSLGSERFFFRKITFIQKGYIQFKIKSKVTVKTFTMLHKIYISNKCCYILFIKVSSFK